MRTIAVVTCILALAAGVQPAHAQDALLQDCQNAQITVAGVSDPGALEPAYRQACAQVVGFLTALHPTIGMAFTGGNPVLGTGSTLGTRLGMIPRVSGTGRVNAAFAEAPNLLAGYDAVLSGSGLPSLESTSIPMAALGVDAAVGLFNGVGFGPLSGLGSVDVLAAVTFIPPLDDAGMTEAILNVGGGVRVGLLKQGLLLPGVSVSGTFRRMSHQSFGDIDAGDPGQLGADLTTVSLRGIASKGVLMFDVAAGVGYDRFTSNVDLAWELECDPSVVPECGTATTLPGSIAGELTSASWNAFANVGLSLLLLHIVAEAGLQFPADILTVDDLQDVGLSTDALPSDPLDGARFFGSLGVRLSI